MRKFLLITGVLVGCLLLSGCWGGYYDDNYGRPTNKGYIRFVANQPIVVDVTIDGVRHFRAQVRDLSRPNQFIGEYPIQPGRRNIRVEWRGRTIYKQTVQIRPRQTKTILLNRY